MSAFILKSQSQSCAMYWGSTAELKASADTTEAFSSRCFETHFWQSGAADTSCQSFCRNI